ncbi:MAG: 50S ribosomal protein L18 [Candidatus Omnitrophica bacterium]|nr:50S ribosomal protein L18 [Candidatus Omnitrophota bacterium]MCF7891865.1 50S ribosomal protein L18 [Candidatus Omnitrophota bacterium]MCF7897684.1 50S ribosomal protein L18 [Candidatus Omnitrophota bacterium]MCF7909472.1 50S ribosomal protein L18 [Candidatus Omnitrophota bacterium]
MKKQAREYRHKRILKKIQGTALRPRLLVFRSHKHVYAQLIDDQAQRVVTGASTLSAQFKGNNAKTADKAAAKEVGKIIADLAKSKKISVVCFDRGGYKFHGRIKSLAEGAREGGLKF